MSFIVIDIMDYLDFVNLAKTTVISSSESSEGNNSPNTSYIEEEIEKFKAIPARKFYSDPVIKQISDSNKFICMVPDHLMKEYSLLNENYYLVSTNDQLGQTKTRGYVPENRDDEFLIKIMEVKSSEGIKNLGKCVILSDIVFHNLGIQKNSYIVLKKPTQYFDDIPFSLPGQEGRSNKNSQKDHLQGHKKFPKSLPN